MLYKISYILNKISDIIYKISYIIPHIRYLFCIINSKMACQRVLYLFPMDSCLIIDSFLGFAEDCN